MGGNAQNHLRLIIIAAALGDLLLFDGGRGAFGALFTLGIFELCAVADVRARLNRKIENERHRTEAEQRAEESRQRRREL